ncbi:molecular chaperone Hsp33 [Kiloniella spongiae]|uniref:Molecular chaperone Hsp33 n=1 Tax=Kiloniella spongiae TaxID=1489064 RepID=A0A0H2MCK9_9PROT|nr:Hsp33 family molecular chaperone HslO [Kiloniella spongiae]KLN59896.1 molecular chaperone Hsp33 [Kiloniella spongiae]
MNDTVGENVGSEFLKDDVIQPFLLESTGIRGRIVRMGPTIDEILKRHDYPQIVNELLGEVLALTSVLSSLMKFSGCFTLQSKSDGPVKMLVSDMTSEGVLRGCAGIDEVALKELLDKTEDHSTLSLTDLTGKGYIAFTVDQGEHMERYQGIVALEGNNLSECIQGYFKQSDQINTGVLVNVAQTEGRWHAGGMILQYVPGDGGVNQQTDKDDDEIKEDWQRSMILMSSCTEDELLDRDLAVTDLLYRLFHEEQVRVYDQRPLKEGCRCSREKLANVIKTVSLEEVDSYKVDGVIDAKCEFCGRSYVFDDAAIAEIQKEAAQS